MARERRVVEALPSNDRRQAEEFAALLRREVAHLEEAVVRAEGRWQRRCETWGYVDPPERLLVVRGRLAEATRMLRALRRRYPTLT